MFLVSFIPLRPETPVGAHPERSDAARNRERLLAAAQELVAEHGADAVTMDMLACKAGVGKGTVFRRFGSRAGLMMTLLSDAESEFQQGFIFGPPPLGPGATPLERLIAFGEGRIRFVMEYGELARAAGATARGRFDSPPVVLWQRHIDMLLRQSGVDVDTRLMALSLSSTLDPGLLLHTVKVHGVAPERLAESWRQLVTRLVNCPGL